MGPLGGIQVMRQINEIMGALMNGISVLVKETSESAFAPSPLWEHSDKSMSAPQKRAVPEPDHGDPLILEIQSPEIHFCYFGLWQFVIETRTD